MLGEVKALDGLDPLLGEDQPPDDVHKEHNRRGNGILFANVHGGLIPGHAQLGSSGHTHPPIAKDAAPKVGHHQRCVDKALQL